MGLATHPGGPSCDEDEDDQSGVTLKVDLKMGTGRRPYRISIASP